MKADFAGAAPCTANVESCLSTFAGAALRARDHLLARSGRAPRSATRTPCTRTRRSARSRVYCRVRWNGGACPSSRAGSSGSSRSRPGTPNGLWEASRDPRTWRWLTDRPARDPGGVERWLGQALGRGGRRSRAPARDRSRRTCRRLDPLPRPPARASVGRDRLDVARIRPPGARGRTSRRSSCSSATPSRAGAADGSSSRRTRSTSGRGAPSRRSGRRSRACTASTCSSGTERTGTARGTASPTTTGRRSGPRLESRLETG